MQIHRRENAQLKPRLSTPTVACANDLSSLRSLSTRPQVNAIDDNPPQECPTGSAMDLSVTDPSTTNQERAAPPPINSTSRLPSQRRLVCGRACVFIGLIVINTVTYLAFKAIVAL